MITKRKYFVFEKKLKEIPNWNSENLKFSEENFFIRGIFRREDYHQKISASEQQCRNLCCSVQRKGVKDNTAILIV